MKTINTAQLVPVLRAHVDANEPVMIWGKPGVGKSDIVKQLSRSYTRVGGGKRKITRPGNPNAANHWPLIDFRATLRDPVDLRGLPITDINAGLTKWLPPAELPNEERDGPEGILFIDELPQASMSMQTALFSLILDRYLGDYKLPEGWRIVAAGNNVSDRSGAQRVALALANRFDHYEVEPNLAAWRKWAESADLDPMVVGFLMFRPTYLHQMPTDPDQKAFPTPRTWERTSRLMKHVGDDIRHMTVEGIVGEVAALEFESFCKIFAHLPSIDEIFANPTKAMLPNLNEISQLHAVTSALVKRVDPKTAANALVYMERLPREFQVVFATSAARRNPDVQATKAFTQWFATNAEILL